MTQTCPARDGDEVSLAEAQEIVAAAVPDRVAIRWRGEVVTHGQFTQRTRSVAAYFQGAGLGSVVPRDALEGWEAGQDFVAIFMHNRPEYLEALFGALKARCVPYNVNYRYGPEEVRELLLGASTKAIVYEAEFGPILAEALRGTGLAPVLIEVDSSPADSSLPGSISLSAIRDTPCTVPLDLGSPDDLYVVFTGGTTGRPKAVMWRQGDAYPTILGGPKRQAHDERPYMDVIAGAVRPKARVAMAAPPFMHGGGQWVALQTLLAGNTLAIQDSVDSLDSADIWRTVERERVSLMLIIGNAYGLPLLDDLDEHTYDLSCLKFVLTGAVSMTPAVKARLHAALPAIAIIETMGATESGTHLRKVTESADESTTARFAPLEGTVVLDETRGHVVDTPGAVGWLARTGALPLGYLGDKDKTNATFLTVGGKRMSVPGDRVRILDGGEIEFLGRDAITINSGGEKIFAEEVETAISSLADVRDVVVTSRPHPRWGEEVVALVSAASAGRLSPDTISAGLSGRLARYKVPKEIRIVEEIPRNPVGKLDYGWAKRQFLPPDTDPSES